MGTDAQVEPQPGGLYLVNVTGARFARGSFSEVVPVHRLAYSFGWDGSETVPPGSSLVEVDLVVGRFVVACDQPGPVEGAFGAGVSSSGMCTVARRVGSPARSSATTAVRSWVLPPYR